jgi:hypothetical protein
MEINMRTFFIALAILLTGFCLFYGCRFNLETMTSTNNYLNNPNNAMNVNNNTNNNSNIANNNTNYLNNGLAGVEGTTSNNLNTGVY